MNPKGVAMNDYELLARVEKLRHLMATQDRDDDFVMPTALREVPSYTSINTVPWNLGEVGGELYRHPERNSG
jgi:hypothetical protein